MVTQAIKSAQSIEEVVQIIDNGGTDSESPEEMAACYAYSETIKKENPDKEALQKELRTLMEAGAIFDYPLALEYGETRLIETLNRATASQGL